MRLDSFTKIYNPKKTHDLFDAPILVCCHPANPQGMAPAPPAVMVAICVLLHVHLCDSWTGFDCELYVITLADRRDGGGGVVKWLLSSELEALLFGNATSTILKCAILHLH